MVMGATVADGWGVEKGEASGTGAITLAGVAAVAGDGNAAGVAATAGIGATTVGSAPASAGAVAAVVTWKSGIDFCTVWYTPHASGTPATSQ